MYPVELHGQQVMLREFTSGDLAGSLGIVGDDEVTSWLSFDSRDEGQARVMLDGIVTRARQQPRTEYYLAVALPADRAVIGFARLGLAGVRAAKLGFAIRRSAWGHGYATDAARTLITFGFGELGLHRISAAAGPDNARQPGGDQPSWDDLRGPHPRSRVHQRRLARQPPVFTPRQRMGARPAGGHRHG